GLLTAIGTLTLICSLEASLSADCEVELLLEPHCLWLTFGSPLPALAPSSPATSAEGPAAPGFCWFSCSVLLWFAEYALFSALFDWFTSPLFDPGLLTATGTLTLVCSLSASLSADCEVELLFEPDWLWLTFGSPLPELPPSLLV